MIRLRLLLALVVTIASGATAGGQPVEEGADAAARQSARLRFLEAFDQAKVGQDVAAIRLPKGWTPDATVLAIDMQTGKWDVRVENGRTVFIIYPYCDRARDGMCVLRPRVVLKVEKPHVTVERLIDAFNRAPKAEVLRVIEYSVDYRDGRKSYKS